MELGESGGMWRVVSTTAEQYAKFAAEHTPNAHVYFISKANKSEVVLKTQQKHCWIADVSERVKVADTSDSSRTKQKLKCRSHNCG